MIFLSGLKKYLFILKRILRVIIKGDRLRAMKAQLLSTMEK